MASGEFHRYPIDDGYLCTDHCHFTWMPVARQPPPKELHSGYVLFVAPR